MTSPSKYFAPQAPVSEDEDVTIEALQRAGIVSSAPTLAKPAGSSPALRIACPVCAAPPGAYCMKGHGKIQVIAHKRRREMEEATRGT
jgi:hypothetical protein